MKYTKDIDKAIDEDSLRKEFECKCRKNWESRIFCSSSDKSDNLCDFSEYFKNGMSANCFAKWLIDKISLLKESNKAKDDKIKALEERLNDKESIKVIRKRKVTKITHTVPLI